MKSAFFFIQVLAVAVCATACRVAMPPNIVTSPATFRQIPSKLIAQKFSSTKKTDIYEIDDNNFLVGPNITVRLDTRIRPISFPRSLTPKHYYFNGEKLPSPTVDNIVHQSAGFSFMFGQNKKISALWGNGLFLQPLDSEKFPGVYVNTRSSHATEFDVGKVAKKKLTLSRKVETSEKQSGSCRLVDIAAAYGNVLCSRFGNDGNQATAYIASIFAQASAELQQDTCHQLRIIGIAAHCQDPNDPYDYRNALSQTAPGDRPNLILSNFRQFWEAGAQHIDRDLAYLFTGYDEGTGVAGAAYVGAACSSYGYGWVEASDITLPIFVHEVGHSLGADHDSSGIMQAVYTGQAIEFSQFSQSQINNYLGGSSASCIASA